MRGKDVKSSKSVLTSKGRLTVPKEVRDRLGLEPGDGLIFEIEDDSVRLEVEKRTTLRELKRSLPAERAYPGKEVERAAARAHVVRRVMGEEPFRSDVLRVDTNVLVRFLTGEMADGAEKLLEKTQGTGDTR